MVKNEKKKYPPLLASNDQPLKDLSYYDFPSLSDEEGVWRYVTNYKLVDRKNHLSNLLIDSDNTYKLICTIIPRPGNNKPRANVVIEIKSYSIDYSEKKQIKGYWLKGRDGSSWYKLIGNSDPSYECFVTDMNHKVDGVLDIYDSFKKYGILYNDPKKKFTEINVNDYENKIIRALQIEKIHANTFKINKITNESTEGFSKEFLAKHADFCIEHISANLLPHLHDFLDKIIREFSNNWKKLEVENSNKENDNKKRKLISSSSTSFSSRPPPFLSSSSSSSLNQLKENDIKSIDVIVNYDIESNKKVKSNDLSCSICNYNFTHFNQYNEHCMSKTHVNNVMSSTFEAVSKLPPIQTCKIYRCDLCDVDFIRKDKYLSHIDSVKHNDKEGSENVDANQIPLLWCKFCKFSTDNRDNFHDHLKSEDHVAIKLTLNYPVQDEIMINNSLNLKDDNLIRKEKVKEKIQEEVQDNALFFNKIIMEDFYPSPISNSKFDANNQIRICTLCNYNGNNYDRHCMTKGHLNLVSSSTHEIVAELPPRITFKIYTCNPCNFETFEKYHWTSHCVTQKHKDKVKSEDVDVNQVPLLWCKLCNFSTSIRNTFYSHLQNRSHLDKLAISKPVQREKLDFIDLDDNVNDDEDNNNNNNNGNNDYEMKQEDYNDLFKYDDSISDINKRKQPVLLNKPKPQTKYLYDDLFDFDDEISTNGKNFDKIVVDNNDKKQISSESMISIIRSKSSSKNNLSIQQNSNQLKEKKNNAKESTMVKLLDSNDSNDENFMNCSVVNSYQPKRVPSVDDLINNASIISINSFSSPIKKNLTINTNPLLLTPINNNMLEELLPIDKPINLNKKSVTWKDMIPFEHLWITHKYDLLSPCQEEENVMRSFEDSDDDEKFYFDEILERKKNKHNLSRP